MPAPFERWSSAVPVLRGSEPGRRSGVRTPPRPGLRRPRAAADRPITGIIAAAPAAAAGRARDAVTVSLPVSLDVTSLIPAARTRHGGP